MDDIFESLKTFVLTEEDLEASTTIVPESPWNKGLPRELQPQYGRKFTKEHRANLSASRMGQTRVIGLEQAKKISIANKGRPKTYVTRLRDKKVVDVQNFYRHP